MILQQKEYYSAAKDDLHTEDKKEIQTWVWILNVSILYMTGLFRQWKHVQKCKQSNMDWKVHVGLSSVQMMHAWEATLYVDYRCT